MTVLIQWSDEYVIDPRLDDEHKHLFDLANTVFAIEDPLRQLAQVKDSVHALYEYLQVHFDHEEGVMETNQYPDYGSHVALHRVIIKNMNQLMTRCQSLHQLLSGLRHLMIDWVTVHIMRHDRRIGTHLQSAEVPLADDAEDLSVIAP